MLGADVSSNLYLLTAFGAGVISFLSPCVLPIVPGYLSLVTGLSVGEIRDANLQAHYLRRIAFYTGLFVAGFTVVFVLLGLVTTAVGSAVFRNQETLTRISGGVVLLMACYLAGSQLLTTPRLYQEFRWHPHLERFGPVAAPVAGAAFGLGWTPCIGPVLGAVLGFAAEGQDVGRAVVLLVAYSAGLGLSFLCVGLAMGKLTLRTRLVQAPLPCDHAGVGRDPRGVRVHPAHRPALRGDRGHVELPARPRVRLDRRHRLTLTRRLAFPVPPAPLMPRSIFCSITKCATSNSGVPTGPPEPRARSRVRPPGAGSTTKVHAPVARRPATIKSWSVGDIMARTRSGSRRAITWRPTSP